MRVLLTGAGGFISGYLIQELRAHGYEVVGVDNFSKYGDLDRSYDGDPGVKIHRVDAKDTHALKSLLDGCDYLIAGAAMIGGISYFHELAYDLLAENERIIASTMDAAIYAHKNMCLRKVLVISSSMVFENAIQFPTKEGHQNICPPPSSTYGFQKLACEYFAKGAYQQYGLPYTIVRPFNCVGIGERRAISDRQIRSGNITLAMSHVVPDLVQKVVKGQRPLRILGDGSQVRHYTYGGDLAKGIVTCMEHPAAICDDFNISTECSTTVLELARNIWHRINGDAGFELESDPPYAHDVQMRIPDVSKAKEVLGVTCETTLDEVLDEVIPWVADQVEKGRL